MATNTFTELRKETVSTATSTITFDLTGISGYTDLRIVASMKANVGSPTDFTALLQFNGDTTSNYSRTLARGTGTAAESARSSNSSFIALQTSGYLSTTVWQNILIDVPNYSNATTNKSVIIRADQTDIVTTASIGLWRKTPEAITSIRIFLESGNYGVGSTFSLYGIRAEGVSPAPKATGGAIYDDETYYYHAFGSSGTFTPTQSITADVLVVAGGGGACNYTGGGAGGLLGFSSQSLTATGYTVTVGAGGASTHGGNNSPAGTNGGDSQFGALTLVKGGGGGGIAASIGSNGINGGSGGGGAPSYGGWGFSAGTQVPQGGTATSGQGNAGGSGSPYQAGPSGISGGGGGGAGGAGSAGAINLAGAGGVGSSTYSSWGVATGIGELSGGTYYLAGGGAGYSNGGSTNSGGLGGGGATVQGGRINTGGGAGGTTGSAGGSGVVIVRYAKV